jgi:Tol biopolymer transport system component
MTSDRRIERDLPDLLDDLYMTSAPTYRDHILQQTARTRQRPAWSFVERWLPMVDIARQPVAAPRIPMRLIGLSLALIGLVLVLIAVAVVGSQTRLPDPFGQARNGLVAYAADGDIFTVDPTTGVSTAIVSGPETDVGPTYSRDGTRLAFERKGGEAGNGQLFVVGSDGSDLTLITPDAPSSLVNYQFSPAADEVMFTSMVESRQDGDSVTIPAISIAKADGSGVRTLDVGFAAIDPVYLPPNGDEIVFVGQPAWGGEASGLYAIGSDSTDIRTIVEPSDMVFSSVAPSPDGSEIAYTAWGVNAGGDHSLGSSEQARVHVTSADGNTTRVLPVLQETALQGNPVWSNDGTRLLVWRCNDSPGGDACVSTLAALPANGRDTGVQLESRLARLADETGLPVWAPDDTSILAGVINPQGSSSAQLVEWDPLDGSAKTLTSNVSGEPSWQRLAR